MAASCPRQGVMRDQRGNVIPEAEGTHCSGAIEGVQTGVGELRQVADVVQPSACLDDVSLELA